MHVSGAVQVPPFSQGFEHKAEINKAKEVPGLILEQKQFTLLFLFC